MKRLTTNRYGQVSPTLIQETGVGISCPFYISLTPDQKKSLLNSFRQIKTEQLANSNENKSSQEPLGTPIEQALGMNEESLRYTLFSRQGLPERLLIRLQKLVGIEFVRRNQVEETYKKWLDYLFLG
tara:strand:+ start:55 stop:435 length:381 start_codon:yes stop_codon:yes gene_type:complete